MLLRLICIRDLHIQIDASICGAFILILGIFTRQVVVTKHNQAKYTQCLEITKKSHFATFEKACAQQACALKACAQQACAQQACAQKACAQKVCAQQACAQQACAQKKVRSKKACAQKAWARKSSKIHVALLAALALL